MFLLQSIILITTRYFVGILITTIKNSLFEARVAWFLYLMQQINYMSDKSHVNIINKIQLLMLQSDWLDRKWLRVLANQQRKTSFLKFKITSANSYFYDKINKDNFLWPTIWILLKQLYLSPSWSPSQLSIRPSASCAIDSGSRNNCKIALHKAKWSEILNALLNVPFLRAKWSMCGVQMFQRRRFVIWLHVGIHDKSGYAFATCH